MSLILDDCKFLNQLEKITNQDVANVIPVGMTKETSERMIRVLTAKKPSDIKDITDEELVELFDYVSSFSKMIGKSKYFDQEGYGRGSFVNMLSGIPSARKRRVL